MCMSRYYFCISDGKRIVRDREGTELGGFSDVQREAIEFGLKVIKHRFNYGIEDPSTCSIRVSNEIGRVLTTIPLGTIKRLARHHA
jgi:hypothetical protein